MPDFSDLIVRLREARDLEYKESQPWSVLQSQIARTAMAMANLSSGGYIVIGIREIAPGQFAPTGIDSEHRRTFSEDAVQSYVNRFADPHLTLELHDIDYEGRRFLVVAVEEFESIPVISKRDSESIRQGAVYVRSRRQNETAEVRSAEEMRAIMNLALEKMLARELSRLRRLSLLPEVNAAIGYDRELEGL